jgi:hypothetical protein
MGAAVLGWAVDADAVVKLAEEADAAAPSSATRGAVIAALSFRAHRALAAEYRAYAELARKTERSLGSSLLLTYVLGREGPLRDKALANADVKRALAQVKAFPDNQDPSDWAALRAAHPAEAAQVAKVCRAERLDLKRKIEEELRPEVRAALESGAACGCAKTAGACAEVLSPETRPAGLPAGAARADGAGRPRGGVRAGQLPEGAAGRGPGRPARARPAVRRYPPSGGGRLPQARGRSHLLNSTTP